MTGNDAYFDLIHNFVEELSYASTGTPEDEAVEKRVGQLTPIIDDANIAYLAVQFIRALWHHDYSVADGCAGDLAGFLLDGLKRTSAAAQDVLDHPLDMTKAIKLVDMVIADALCGPNLIRPSLQKYGCMLGDATGLVNLHISRSTRHLTHLARCSLYLRRPSNRGRTDTALQCVMLNTKSRSAV